VRQHPGSNHIIVSVDSGVVTALLRKWSEGDLRAVDELTPVVYDELRRMARRFLRREKEGHSLRSADLVHEAYLKLVDQRQVNLQDRAHFFAVSSQIMRRILVDHARAQQAAKRGGGATKLALLENIDVPSERGYEMIALDDALHTLAKLDAQQSRIVELRFFGGLSIEETAALLGISKTTVNRDWVTARAWLNREVERSGAAGPVKTVPHST
jgi:RNA polymerase sigma factor (TIGR02999 family)